MHLFVKGLENFQDQKNCLPQCGHGVKQTLITTNTPITDRKSSIGAIEELGPSNDCVSKLNATPTSVIMRPIFLILSVLLSSIF